MSRQISVSLLALASLGTIAGPARSQTTRPVPATRPAPQSPVITTRIDAATALAEALRANPITAPYRISVTSRDGNLVLGGRVGSSGVHDAAVRTAIALGISRIKDDLVIDTTEAVRAAAMPSGPYPSARPASILSSYTYPPPLFGRYDEPFFGYEPPLITYPAWWGPLSQARLGPGAGQPVVPAEEPAAALPPNTVEATIDPLGVAVLRGSVPTEADKIAVGQQLAQTQGVSQVINRLTITPAGTGPPQGARRPAEEDQPPPPPTPSEARPQRDPIEPSGIPIRPGPAPSNTSPATAPARTPTPSPRIERRPAAPGDSLGGRVDRAIQARPELAGQAVKVSVKDGIASLSGSVPTVYEAMLAFRTVQQSPGVKEVVDSLQFVVPDGTAPNPLLSRARPEDVEPYLEAQIRRQVADAAHLDRVRLEGADLRVSGTLDHTDDRPRVEAILRSMPVLRGFRITPEFRELDGARPAEPARPEALQTDGLRRGSSPRLPLIGSRVGA